MKRLKKDTQSKFLEFQILQLLKETDKRLKANGKQAIFLFSVVDWNWLAMEARAGNIANHENEISVFSFEKTPRLDSVASWIQ